MFDTLYSIKKCHIPVYIASKNVQKCFIIQMDWHHTNGDSALQAREVWSVGTVACVVFSVTYFSWCIPSTMSPTFLFSRTIFGQD